MVHPNLVDNVTLVETLSPLREEHRRETELSTVMRGTTEFLGHDLFLVQLPEQFQRHHASPAAWFRAAKPAGRQCHIRSSIGLEVDGAAHEEGISSSSACQGSAIVRWLSLVLRGT